jgi:hypothetical protein
LPSGGHGGVKLVGIWLAAFCSASSHVLAGHHAAHQKFLNHKLNIEKRSSRQAQA